jgi:hypothetical protein
MASTKLTAIRIAIIAAFAAASLIATPTFANTHNTVIPVKYKTISEKNDGQKYEINVDYPYLESSDASSLSFNQTAEKIATENVAAFKESLSPPTTDQSSGLEVTYDVLRSDSEYISVRFGVSAFLAGMAHPSYASRVLNWDVRNGKALVLDDVFKPKSGYLRTVANYCTSLLRRQKKLDFPTGAQPKDLNYVNWNININKGLLISYDPYQVGPWAAGRIECQVPLKTLSRILKEPKRWAA